MNFLSVCSGIEAASVAWQPLGWKAVGFSEIEPFPCALLAHHYPNVPNFGDMTKFKDWPDDLSVDLLCGGTPCQSFSVAGLRKGLDDPRGNLMLVYGAIAAKYRPQWLVYENVPGLLSSNGGDDFRSFLDMLELLGYVCDIDILDAQFFGVPQRRRRIFVCAQSAEHLVNQKTDTSALTIAQCLQEILHSILVLASREYGSVPQNLASAYLSKDGVMRRMKLFGLHGEADYSQMLLENLVEAFQRSQQDQRQLDARLGAHAKEHIQAGQSTDSSTASLFTLTEQSLKSALVDAFAVMKSFITLTETSSTTQTEIFTCSRAALLIAKLTPLLNQSSPSFWSAASSSLTGLEEFTEYARHTSSDIFGDMERVSAWLDFIEQAECAADALADIGIECFGEIFPVSACLSGHPAPSRKAGQAVTGTLSARTEGGGGLGTDFDCSGGLQPVGTLCIATGQDPVIAVQAFGGNDTRGPIEVATARNACASASGRMDFESETFLVTHSLRGEGFDASEDGTGRGTPLVPLECIAFQERGRADGPELDIGGEIAYALTAPKDGGRAQERNILTPTMQVRRLTPRECERLQGFPAIREVLTSETLPDSFSFEIDVEADYTAVPHRGKPAADGPRYKALGNSWAVPCAAWIGQRIKQVEAGQTIRQAA